MKFSDYAECGINVTTNCFLVLVTFIIGFPFFLIGFALKRFIK